MLVTSTPGATGTASASSADAVCTATSWICAVTRRRPVHRCGVCCPVVSQARSNAKLRLQPRANGDADAFGARGALRALVLITTVTLMMGYAPLTRAVVDALTCDVQRITVVEYAALLQGGAAFQGGPTPTTLHIWEHGRQ